ncbi:hypothetical protein SEUCBS139899_006760 [Sporothrix eucalyptigena]|uniref:Uncharacterized protein n=1 Tax=Sporothrix eucalyptigena TaxID=1812306 RepID=A0ABP0CI60_9PEZI
MDKRRQQPTYESDEDVSDQQYEDEQPQQQRNTRVQRRPQRQQQQQQGGQGPLDNLQLDSLGNTAQGVVGGVTNTLGGLAGGAVQGQQGGGDSKKGSDTLRLRLDLNLDIEITLKAKIHGDLELALLET